jgi:Skp family chaperone for outer membrane proteins
MISATTIQFTIRLKKHFGWAAVVLPLCCLCAAAAPDAPTDSRSVTDLPARLQAAQTRLEKISGSLNTTDHDLDQLTNNAGLDLDSLKAQAQKLADQQAAQTKTLAELEGQIDILSKAWQTKASKTNAPLSDLQNQVREAQNELNRLAQEEAQILAQAGNQGANATLGRTRILAQDMSPIYVALIKNRVLPMRSPYFQTTLAFSGSSLVQRISPQGVGEAIGQATKLGGCLDLLLKDSNPKTHYFFFWVCPDSIPAFHAARQFALNNKYTYTWTTYDGTSLSVVGGSASNVRGIGGTQ